MNDVDALLADLGRAQQILLICEENSWASNVAHAAALVTKEPRVGAIELMSFFGTSGTLNDLVLYRDGDVLLQENDELDELKKQIYKRAKIIRLT